MKKRKVNLLFFILGTISIVFICMTGNITNMNQQNFSVIEVLLTLSQEEKKRYDCYQAFMAGTNSWITLILPIIVSIPTIPLFTDEINSKFYQFNIGRLGLSQYIRRTYINAVVYGALVVITGLFLYSLFVVCLFPIVADYGSIEVIGQENTQFFQLYNVCIITLRLTLWGCSMSACAYICASIFSSKYVVLCIPLLFNYIMQNIIWKYTFFVTAIILTGSYVLGHKIWFWKYREIKL